jgi:prepilin-type N-terminal cleavage/methylation domain-containing protein
MRPERPQGFTLLEVLIAMFVLALAIGGLVTAMAQSFHKLADARDDLRQLELAEAQVRELDQSAQGGALPELGHSSGTFDPPYEQWAWDLVVEPWSLPLPEGYGGQGLPSSVFQPPGTASPVQPSVRLLSYRVYPVEGSPDDVDPFVALAVEKVPPELVAEAAAREQQAAEQSGAEAQRPLGSGATTPVQGTPTPGSSRP